MLTLCKDFFYCYTVKPSQALGKEWIEFFV